MNMQEKDIEKKKEKIQEQSPYLIYMGCGPYRALRKKEENMQNNVECDTNEEINETSTSAEHDHDKVSKYLKRPFIATSYFDLTYRDKVGRALVEKARKEKEDSQEM